MSSSSEITYCLIFDTNALFQAYEKKADFTTFSFNATFEHVVGMIEQLDIYEYVTMAIPSVVWSEMEKQIIEKHDELLVTYKSTISKKQFPEYSIQENPTINYPEYIKIKIEEYKKEISGRGNSVIEIPIASNNRFESIVNRAFSKLPPFEAESIWPYPILTAAELAPYQVEEKAVQKYSLETYDVNAFTRILFESLDKRIMNLSPAVKKEYKKLYVAYKLDTNFVDIVFQKQRLRISINMKFSEINDPNGICKDVTGLGRWGNGDVELFMEHQDELDQIMEIVKQSFDAQAE